MGLDRTKAGALSLLLLTAPIAAQEAGWHYSPFPGEGDRATLACAPGATIQSFTCLAVRCEDDFSVGYYIHTSRLEGDGGDWLFTIDKENLTLRATATPGPYHARLAGDLPMLHDRLEQGGVLQMTPLQGSQPVHNNLSLANSLHAIRSALFYCAPKRPAGEPIEDPRVTPTQLQGE